ncbi:MAG: glycine cleavage system protein T [Betaproteobacteria bacterium SG8_40]|jgi:aminomethyltransferase|nr:MAG: glycine cleavage system protein T [Betaproteobacteria bacterium SG8_40]
MLRRTPLYEAHLKLKAKLVDFGGWEMPLHYGSQIEEHHSVRRDAGMFDVSHMLAIDIQGDQSRPYLLGLLANNVERLAEPGEALYSCMLNEQGGVIDDLIVYRMASGTYRLVVNAGTAEKDLEWLALQRDRSAPDVDIVARRDLSMIAVQGPNARTKLWRAEPGTESASHQIPPFCATTCGDWLIARTGYTGEDGFEVTLPSADATGLWDALLAQGVAPAGLGARDTLRLEAGMNLYGQDMDETVTPMESGLAWTVDLASSRNFIGKQAVAGSVPGRKLMGLVLRERGVLRAHQKVQTPLGDGETTSGTFSPTLGLSIALARLPVGVDYGEDVRVAVRGRDLSARTVKYPFVRHGKSLIDDQLD